MAPSLVVLAAAVALLAGLGLGWALGALGPGRRLAEQGAALARATVEAGRCAPLELRVRELTAELSALREERGRLAAELEAEQRVALERRSEAERVREQVRAEVTLQAGRLVDVKGEALLERGRERLAALLSPVAERLRAFEARVELTHDQGTRDRAALLESLRQLQEAQVRLQDDAESLTRALTGDSKAQGDWGELVLERVLEAAGLTAGRDYDLQLARRDEEGALRRPDAVVYLPGERAVVVDAKCSLTAFVEASRADLPAARDAALAAHVGSVRAHVRELARKSYGDVLQERTLDLVLMFVPSEAAFHAAVGRDTGLHAEAFRQGVVVCSPATLLAALRLIAHLWRSERQHQNAERIAEEAGKLLEKLAAFVADLDEVGDRLQQARRSFDQARAKLATGRGNVLGRAREVAALGAPLKTERARVLLTLGDPDEGEQAVAAEPALGG